MTCIALAFLSLVGWAGVAAFRSASAEPAGFEIPTTEVRRGDIAFSISARGELQGGASMMLGAPMAGGVQLVIVSLKQAGDLVKAGDVVVEFDATELTFNMREAEADLAEAEQQLLKAKAGNEARQEEARFSLVQAESQLRLAELDARRNDLLAAIVAKQNDLAVESAKDRLRQLREDLANRQATSEASIAIQEAAQSKARVKADTTRKMIDSMTLRAPVDGYVSIRQNTNGPIMYGMQAPIFQLGDTVRPGMAVAQVLNLGSMQVSARIGELDRGHLAVDQAAKVRVVAEADRVFAGRIINIGNTTGPPWDRRFECKLALDDPAPGLRPGMSARIEIVTAELSDELWLPSQALFDRDGQKFVYLAERGAFSPVDVELVRSGESQVVIHGVDEGQIVALADPTVRADSGASSSASDAMATP